MEFLESLYLTGVMHTISSDLLIPVVILLLALVIYALYTIGAIIVEAAVERRRYRAHIPELVARLDAASYEELGDVIEDSGLLRSQKDDLDELVSYLYLPEDARTEVAKRLLANEARDYRKLVNRTATMAKITPMLGLMATLIPLGPGVVALGSGDTQILSDSLNTAFDGTVVGLVTAVVCLIVTGVRKGWYDDYLISMEAAFNTLLEKAEGLHAQGFEFPREVYSYNKSGRRAKKRSIDGAVAGKLPIEGVDADDAAQRKGE